MSIETDLALPFTHPSCPWSQFDLGFLSSCEERMCSWIRQPNNTISNIAYILFAFLLYRLWKKTKNESYRTFAVFTAIVAAASALAHASQIVFFILIDYASQFLIFSFLIVSNYTRLQMVEPKKKLLYTLSAFILSVGVLSINRRLSFTLIGINLILLIYTEWRCYKIRTSITYGHFKKAGLLLVLGLICFFLDIKKIVCIPENHFFQLHAFWHIFSAWSLFECARFYAQFDKKIDV